MDQNYAIYLPTNLSAVLFVGTTVWTLEDEIKKLRQVNR